MPMPHGGDVPGIDADSERGKAFFLVAAVVAFFVSAWHAVSELRYVARGQLTTATVNRVNPASEPGRGRPKEYLRIEVDFSDGNEPRRAVLKRPIGTPISPGQQVDIEYLPGAADRVRFRGDRPIVWLLVLGAATAWVFWSICRLKAELQRSRRGLSGRRRGPLRPSPD